jgi:hypothetical protein
MKGKLMPMVPPQIEVTVTVSGLTVDEMFVLQGYRSLRNPGRGTLYIEFLDGRLKHYKCQNDMSQTLRTLLGQAEPGFHGNPNRRLREGDG